MSLVHDLNLISRAGRDGGGVTGEQAAKPSTAVQLCVSIFVSGKPLDIFKETVGRFQAVFVVTKKRCF